MKYILRLSIFPVIVLGAVSALSQSQISVDDSIQLEEVVITAQFVPTDTRETVNRLHVLDKEAIRERAAVTLTDLLRTEPQFRIRHDMILGSSLTVNGMPANNVKILIDGIPVIGRLDGGIDAGQLPMSSVQKVEIIEGAQSLIYGSSASAGVVNLLTKTHQLYKVECEVNGLYESEGQRSLDARVGVRIDDLGVAVSAGTMQFDVNPESPDRDQLWNPKLQKFGRMALTFVPNADITLKVSAGVFDEEVTNLGDMRRPMFKPYAFDDYYDTDRREVSLHGEGWLWDDYYWQVSAAYPSFDRQKRSVRYEFEDGTQSLIEGMQDTSAATGLVLRSTFASNTRTKAWDFLAGTEYSRETLEDARIIDVLHHETGFAGTAELSGFASMKYRFGSSLVLQGGTRITRHSVYGMAVTPSVWMAWRPRQWRIRFSYANGFRSPDLKELYFSFIDLNHHITGNPDLIPERSHNFRAEVNREKKFLSWKISATISGFYNSIKDRIALAEISVVEYSYLNIAKWQTSGGGISVELEKPDRIEFKSTFLLTEYFNTLSGSHDVPQASMSPDWSNSLDINILKGKLGLSVWHKWTGKTPYYFLGEDEEILYDEREGWHDLNASAKFIPAAAFQFTTGIKNILDVRERVSLASGGSVHGGGSVQHVHWGRTFFIQVTCILHSKK